MLERSWSQIRRNQRKRKRLQRKKSIGKSLSLIQSKLNVTDAEDSLRLRALQHMCEVAYRAQARQEQLPVAVAGTNPNLWTPSTKGPQVQMQLLSLLPQPSPTKTWRWTQRKELTKKPPPRLLWMTRPLTPENLTRTTLQKHLQNKREEKFASGIKERELTNL